MSCLECTEKMKNARGCRKPGANYEGSEVFRTTSPLLHDIGDFILHECPIGYVQRESPYIYDMLNLTPYIESGNLGPKDLPRTTQRALAIASSERDRLREMGNKRIAGQRDSAFGTQMIRSRRG